ncbi:MAG: glycosyltransferase family 39 protein [Devosiaceae bacterium]|nr:glycosyltransferase family 39 protein [Devosiaceae bacterium MH13]
MTAATATDQPARDYARLLMAIVTAIVVARLVVTVFTPLDLFYDEAQYWFWSQDLALGYFSKPPLIAWLIAGSTALCGDSEACIRAPAAIVHGVTSLLVFAVGRALYDARTGFYAGLAYCLGMAVSVSSLLISTDVPLLLCWVAGLWAFARFLEAPSIALALAFGACIAVGLNAKYAMIYFPLCALAYLIATADRRHLLRAPALWLGIGVGMLGFVPNLIWNVQNDFITFTHTGENIAGSGAEAGFQIDPVSFLEYAGSQFFIASPILFVVFGLVVFARWRSDAPHWDRFLLFMSLPILALLGLQAFQSQANPNWAATAFPALILVTSATLLARGRFVWIRRNLILCGAVAALIGVAALSALLVRPDNPVIARTNLEDMFGWAEHAEVLDEQLDALQVDTIVTAGRRYSAGFAYYLRHRPERFVAFLAPGRSPRSHFEFIQPWSAPEAGETAVIMLPSDNGLVEGAERVGVVAANAGTAPFRSDTYLYRVEGPDE